MRNNQFPSVTTNKKEIKILLLTVLFFALLMSRFAWLTDFPAGFHIDEAGAGYDALSLARYGVDRYLKSWPLYLTNYGSGQSSLYAFLCAGLFKLFGYSKFLLRLPAALCSILVWAAGVRLSDRLFGKDSFYTVFTAFLIVICPYFVMSSRFAYDCNLMLGLSVVFLDQLTDAIRGQKRALFQYFAAGVTGGILLYTYALSYIILPLFLVLALIYLLRIRAFSLKGWICMAVPLFLLALPLMMIQIINLTDLPEMHLGIFTLTKLDRYRGSEIEFPTISKILRMKDALLVGDDLRFDSLPGFPNLLKPSLILLPLGFFRGLLRLLENLKSGKKSPAKQPLRPLITLWFLAVTGFECCINSLTYTLNPAFFAAVFLITEAVEGLPLIAVPVMQKFFPKVFGEKKQRFKVIQRTKMIIFGCFACLYLAYGIRFQTYYFGTYREAGILEDYFASDTAAAFRFIQRSGAPAETIYCSDPPIVYLLTMEVSPYEIEDPSDFAYHTTASFRNITFASVGGVDTNAAYILKPGLFPELCTDLLASGFIRQSFPECDLYYFPSLSGGN